MTTHHVPLYLALVHHPVVNKRGDVITTSVTNIDIHDIARSCRTFGFQNYFIITPIVLQQQLVQKILDHWNTDFANDYNPDRQSALSFIKVLNTLGDCLDHIGKLHGAPPLVVATAAKMQSVSGNISDICGKAKLDKRPILLILGTGWGLHSEILDSADFRLKPIYGSAIDGYNHLSVRSAAAIYCSAFAGEIL